MQSVPLVGLSFALCGALVFGAPQQGSAPFELSIETNLVILPVTVVDKRGAAIPDLARSAFTVYDNGIPQEIQFFTNEALPATIGLVIDSSSSMVARRQEVTAAGTTFAALGHPLDQLFLVNFNETVWLGLPPAVRFAEGIEQLHTALARAPARGMTALYDAVDRSLEQLEFGTRERKILIVVSDGGDNASAQTLDGVLEHARRANITIYAVIVVDPDDPDAKPDALKKLAKETGGSAFMPSRSGDVVRAFQRIAHEIRSGYAIGFKPPDVREGGFRSIRVVVKAGGARQLSVRTRAGYYAAPSRRGIT